MAVFGYDRVGAKEPATENRRRTIESAGYPLDYWLADEGTSGKTTAMQRPRFAAMMEELKDGDTLIVARLDCLGRDAEDVLKTVRGLAGRAVRVVVLQLGKLDLGSPEASPMLAMLAAVANMERDVLAESTKSGLAKAKAEGKTLGRPAKTSAEQRAAIITAYSVGTSVSELARRFNVSRASILGIVRPKNMHEEPLPMAWGD